MDAAAKRMMREGKTATIVIHSAIYGERKREVRRFEVSEVKPYAQHEKTVVISFVEPRKRQWMSARVVPNDPRYITIEDCKGHEVYDSRADVPCNMTKWHEVRERWFPRQ